MNITTIDNTNYNNNNFKGIKIQKGGLEFVLKEGGEKATNYLLKIKEQCKNYKCVLYVDKSGYSIYSPYSNKIYKNIFFPRRHNKKSSDNIKYQLNLADNNNRHQNFTIGYDAKEERDTVYKKIKNSKGLRHMLEVYNALEKMYFERKNKVKFSKPVLDEIV